MSNVRAPEAPSSTADQSDSATRRLLPRLLIWTPAVVLAGFLAAAIRAGIPAADTLRGLVAIAVTQLLPGILLWRVVRPVRGWWVEDLAVGFALGIGFAVLSQTVAGTLQTPWLAAVPGPIAAALIVGVPATRRRVRAARTESLPPAWGPAVAAVAVLHLLPTQSFYRSTPLMWEGGFRDIYVDMPFHLALASELAHRGPSGMPHVVGEALNYHWFSHAWVAQVGVVGGVPLDAVLFRLLPAIIGVTATLAVASAAVRVSNRAWAGPLAALFAVAAGDFDVFGDPRAPTFIAQLSPSLGLSVPLVTGLVVVLVCRWRNAARPGIIVALAALSLAATGMKGSALPVVLAGTALAVAAAMILKHHLWRRILIDFSILTVALLAGYVTIFGGRSGSLRFDPAETLVATGLGRAIATGGPPLGPLATSLIGILVLLSVLARGIGIVGLLTSRTGRRDPVTWLLLGTGLAGAIAVVSLAHSGQSQYYFLRNASPVLVIGSAWGLLNLFDLVEDKARALSVGALVGVVGNQLSSEWFDLAPGAGVRAALMSLAVFLTVVAAGAAMGRPRSRAVAASIAAVAVSAACIVPVVVRESTRRLPPYAIDVEPTTPSAFSDDQLRAARWLRDHSSRNAILVTNRHCLSPVGERCDSRRFHVAAYTERRVLVEGWGYTPSWSQSEFPRGDRPFANESLLQLNDGFLRDPTADAAQRLRDLGVDWIFIDKTAPYDEGLAEFATLRLDTQWAQVYEMPTDAAS